MKVVYFDETAATDYITIQNGGQIDWTTTENKERLAKIIAEIDVQAKGGFNLFHLSSLRYLEIPMQTLMQTLAS